jgi:hypothetical protein
LLLAAIDEQVHERRPLIVDAVDAVGARGGALDAHGRVRVDEPLHVVGNPPRELAARRDDLLIHGHPRHTSSLARLHC